MKYSVGPNGRLLYWAKVQLCMSPKTRIWKLLYAKFDFPVARQNCSLLATAHACETCKLQANISCFIHRQEGWYFGWCGSCNRLWRAAGRAYCDWQLGVLEEVPSSQPPARRLLQRHLHERSAVRGLWAGGGLSGKQ